MPQSQIEYLSFQRDLESLVQLTTILRTKIMKLTYRGQSYQQTAMSLGKSDATVSGKFLGAPSQISLPHRFKSKQTEAQLIYRGVPLSV